MLGIPFSPWRSESLVGLVLPGPGVGMVVGLNWFEIFGFNSGSTALQPRWYYTPVRRAFPYSTS